MQVNKWFDDWRKLSEYLEELGYNTDNEIDLEEEPYKRETHESFYLHNPTTDRYAQVDSYRHYDYGRNNCTLVAIDLIRKEEQVVVTTTKVTYLDS